MAQNYAQCWQLLVNGGMIGITSLDRMDRAQVTRHELDSLAARDSQTPAGPAT
jgi:hypothetical protein